MYCFVKHSVLFQHLKIPSKRADIETQITVQLLFNSIIFWKKIKGINKNIALLLFYYAKGNYYNLF